MKHLLRFGPDGSRAEDMLLKIERRAYRTRRRSTKAWRRAYRQATREDLWWGGGPHGRGSEDERRTL